VNLGQELTNELIKDKLKDGNGGQAWIFCELFKRLDKVVKKVTGIENSLKPILDERASKKAVVGWFGDIKANITATIIFGLLLYDVIIRLF
jgi:hypothetical protein